MNCVTFPMMSTHCMRYKLNFETTDKKTTKQKAISYEGFSILVCAEITLVLKTWSKAKLALSTPIKSYGSLFGVSHLVVETWKTAYSIKNNANPQFASSFQGFNRERICSLMYYRCTRTLNWSSLPLGRQRQIWTADYWFHSILLHLKLVTEERFWKSCDAFVSKLG